MSDKTKVNDRQVKAVLHVKGKITNSDYHQINDTSARTAVRDLETLVTKGIFRRKGQRKGAFYELAHGVNGVIRLRIWLNWLIMGSSFEPIAPLTQEAVGFVSIITNLTKPLRATGFKKMVILSNTSLLSTMPTHHPVDGTLMSLHQQDNSYWTTV